MNAVRFHEGAGGVFFAGVWYNFVMAEKDAAEKTLESYNDVFADIVNVLLFKGK